MEAGQKWLKEIPTSLLVLQTATGSQLRTPAASVAKVRQKHRPAIHCDSHTLVRISIVCSWALVHSSNFHQQLRAILLANIGTLPTKPTTVATTEATRPKPGKPWCRTSKLACHLNALGCTFVADAPHIMTMWVLCNLWRVPWLLCGESVGCRLVAIFYVSQMRCAF